MGPAPKKPDPLGVAPKPGFQHPKFPVIGQLDPSGTYRSYIGTQSPISASLTQRLSSTPQAFKAKGSTSSGDASRDAAARGMSDMTNTAMRRSADDFSTQYRTQAEKSRADDVLAQRQNTTDRFRLDTLRDVYMTDVSTGFDQKVKDLAAYYQRERKNSEAMVTAAMMRMLGGLI